MTVKLIETTTRPNLEIPFVQEYLKKGIVNYIDDDDLSKNQYVVEPLTKIWVEEISINEILTRQNELRGDLQILFNDLIPYINQTPNIFRLIANPFSLTNTKIQLFNSETDMRLSKKMLMTVPRYAENIDIIKKFKNTITIQLYVDEKLIEVIEFK